MRLTAVTPSTRHRATVSLTTGLTTALIAMGGVAGPAEAALPQPDSRPVHSNENRPRAHTFDLQAHRGGIGLTVESTIASFSKALDLGVSTLELDVQITKDGYAVVTHDRDPVETKCTDTAPATPGDPQFPYVPGKSYIKDLTLAQVRTLDCGSKAQPQFPGQQLAPGAQMPLLSEVFALVRARHATGVKLNVETKVEAGAPEQTAPREQFVQVVAHEVRRAHLLRQVSVQSFDWGALMRMRQVEPRLPIVALTNGQQFLQAGAPGASPWLGGIDIDDFGGSLVAAAASFHADAISPVAGDPQNGKVTDPGYVPYTTPAMVHEAHAAGMAVIPWTVEDDATMQSLIDAGVDGLITDYPDVARQVMARNGLALPRAYPARRGSGSVGHHSTTDLP
jgi:glycerophosphoryl diester phosphodiesterase